MGDIKATFPDALRVAISRAIAGIHTALPGKVEKYDHEKQMASVQPLIKKLYLDNKVESLPVIENVPVIFPRTSNFSFTHPIEEGDLVLLLFCERSLEKYLAEGGEQEPGDRRKHDLTDAMAIPGLYPFSETSEADNNEDVLIKFHEAELRIKPDGNFYMKGSLIVDGDVVADEISLKSHLHSAVSTGDDISGPPVVI